MLPVAPGAIKWQCRYVLSTWQQLQAASFKFSALNYEVIQINTLYLEILVLLLLSLLCTNKIKVS